MRMKTKEKIWSHMDFRIYRAEILRIRQLKQIHNGLVQVGSGLVSNRELY